MSKTYDDTNTFILFVNLKEGNEKRPDRKGKLNVDGKEYQLSGWIVTDDEGKPKKDKNGNPMLRGKVEPVQGQEAQQRPAPKQIAPSDDELDELPF